MKFERIRILIPLVFWLFQFIIHIIRNIYDIIEISFISVLQPIIINYPLNIITFCIFYFFFAPRFYKKSDLNLYIFFSILYVHAFGFVWILSYYFSGMKDVSQMKVYYLSSIGYSLLYAAYGIITRLALEWYATRDKSKELEKQNLKTELALLRSQVNPHFLFNILNNISSFALKKYEKTYHAIIKLSDIMRYMTYEAKEDYVLISKEITYIENYLELQKLRYKESDFINFEVSIDANDLKIPPMLFIPFIENAFKHGIKGRNGEINIQLIVENNRIYFNCSNKLRELSETEKQQPRGIGVENVKKRLKLLFPDKHELNIYKTDEHYKVDLEIQV